MPCESQQRTQKYVETMKEQKRNENYNAHLRQEIERENCRQKVAGTA